MATTSDTRPLSRTALNRAAPHVAQHEHAWATESRHRTSEGYVVYVRCGTCQARRIDLQRRYDAPPTAQTKLFSAVGNNP